jgi:FG-GAP repeat
LNQHGFLRHNGHIFRLDVQLLMTHLILRPLTPDLNHPAPRDKFGHAIALAADGQTLAIGAPYHDQPLISSGSVQIYARRDDEWQPIGEPIRGRRPLEFCGWSVALSADGHTLAIGATGGGPDAAQPSGSVQIYKRQADRWVTFGAPITGTAPNELMGSAIALSADGNTLAIGAPLHDGNGTNSGQVQVYRYDDTNPTSPWMQIGTDLRGAAAQSYFGSAIALSHDGQFLAIGAPRSDQGNGPESGAVYLYQWGESDWVPLGQLIGRHRREWFGGAIALSLDAQTIAIGAPGHDDNRGSIRVYQRQMGFWQQQGDELTGAPGEGWGHTVAIAAGGTIVAGGTTATLGRADLLAPQAVRTYRYVHPQWQPHGQAQGGGRFGQGLALSQDGQTLAIGAPGHDQNLGDSGFVRLVHRPLPNPKPTIRRTPKQATLQLAPRDVDAPWITLTDGRGQPIALSADWKIVDTDQRAAGPIDLLLHSLDRDTVQCWQLDPAGRVISQTDLRNLAGAVLHTRNPHWRLIGWADFAQTQLLKLLWHNPISDEIAFWSLAADRATVTDYDYLLDARGQRVKTQNPSWEICAIVDLDRNGQPDLLLRLPALNQTAVIRLKGTIFVTAQYLPGPPIVDLGYRDITFWEGDNRVTINWQNASQTQLVQQTVRCVAGEFVADRFITLESTAIG